MKRHWGITLATTAILAVTMLVGGCTTKPDTQQQATTAINTSIRTDGTYTPVCTPNPDMDQAVATVNGEKVSKREYLAVYGNMVLSYQQQGINVDSANDEGKKNLEEIRKTALDEAIKFELFRQATKKAGLDKVTADEVDQIVEYIDGQVDQYVASKFDETKEKNQGKSDEEIRNILADEFWESAEGYNRDLAIMQQLDFIGIDKYMESITAGVVVKEKDISDKYEALKKEQKEKYTQNPALYESDVENSKYDSKIVIAYQPDGFYRVQSILIKITDSELADIDELLQAGKKKEALELRNKALAKIEKEAKEVLKKAHAKDADFEKLIMDYGADPGMHTQATREEGYLVWKDSKTWIPEYVEGAMALKKEGDISKELVASDYGYFIIKLHKKVKEGPVPYMDLMEKIEKNMPDELKNKKLDEKYKELLAAAKIEKFMDKIPAVK